MTGRESPGSNRPKAFGSQTAHRRRREGRNVGDLAAVMFFGLRETAGSCAGAPWSVCRASVRRKRRRNQGVPARETSASDSRNTRAGRLLANGDRSL